MFYSDYKGICTCWQQQPNPSQIKPIDRIFFHYFSARWTLFLYQQHNASKQDRSNERLWASGRSSYLLDVIGIGCTKNERSVDRSAHAAYKSSNNCNWCLGRILPKKGTLVMSNKLRNILVTLNQVVSQKGIENQKILGR